MKKILFGILLIFISIAFVLAGEFENTIIIGEDFDSVLCTILPVLGFIMGIWGLLEKDK